MTAKDLKRIIELDNKTKQLTLVIEQASVARQYRGGTPGNIPRSKNTPRPLDQGAEGAIYAEYNKTIEELKDLRQRALAIIMQMERPKQQTVLILRYINGMQWGEILDKMGSSDRRALLRLHQRALHSFDNITTHTSKGE